MPKIFKRSGGYDTPVNEHSNGKYGPFEDVFPIENGDSRLLC